MGKGFKLTLRTALVLLILAGATLIVYTSLLGSPSRAPAQVSSAVHRIVSRVRPRPAAPASRPAPASAQPLAAAVRPSAPPKAAQPSGSPAPSASVPRPASAQPPASGQPPASAQPTPTAQPQPAASPEPAAQPQPPAPPQAVPTDGGSATAPASGPQAGTPKAGAGGPTEARQQTELVDFSMVLHDSEKNREEATVVGDRALLREQEKTYQVFNPLVVVLLWPSDGQPVDVELPKLHLKADQADVDEAQGIVRFFGNVTATGEDFEVTTDGVVYAVNERTLTSDKPVRMQRDKVDKAGNKTPALVVTGLGLNADLGLQNMSVLKDAMAHVYNVSEDFLATGLEKPASTGAGREVVITSDGPLLYEHMARRVTFSDNVAAVSDQKKLTSQKLTISLGTSDAGKRVEVTDIVATGKAQLSYQDQVARGDKLEWHNVTQTGVLTGSPAVLVTPQFELTGKELTFYRLNDRFHSEGPGSLLWKSGAKGAGVADEAHAGREAAETPWDIGPLRLSGGAPVHVTWTDSMTYHAAAHVATFKGQVVAQQQESALECNELVLNFEPTAGAIQKVEAAGAVDVRDAQSPGGRNLGSDRLVWDATRDKVELVAREGETVNVESGGRSVASSHVVVDNSGQTMDCPAEGRLTVKPTPAKGGRAAQSAPVVVDWRKEMHFAQRPSPVALFAGSATARQGDQQITGETLRAEFDEKMSPLRIWRGAAPRLRSGPPRRPPPRPPEARRAWCRPSPADVGA